jgi:hypothetical protein
MSPTLGSRWATWGTASSGFRGIELRGGRLVSVGLLAPFLAPAPPLGSPSRMQREAHYRTLAPGAQSISRRKDAPATGTPDPSSPLSVLRPALDVRAFQTGPEAIRSNGQRKSSRLASWLARCRDTPSSADLRMPASFTHLRRFGHSPLLMASEMVFVDDPQVTDVGTSFLSHAFGGRLQIMRDARCAAPRCEVNWLLYGQPRPVSCPVSPPRTLSRSWSTSVCLSTCLTVAD